MSVHRFRSRPSSRTLQAALDKGIVDDSASAVHAAESAISKYTTFVDDCLRSKESVGRDEVRARWYAAVVEFRSILGSETLMHVVQPSDILAKLDAQASVASLGLLQVSSGVLIYANADPASVACPSPYKSCRLSVRRLTAYGKLAKARRRGIHRHSECLHP